MRTTSAPSARARRAVSSPMPALPPISDDGLSQQSGSRVVHVAAHDRLAICASIGLIGRGMSAICMRSAFTAAS